MDEKLNKKVVVISVIAVVALVIGITLAFFIVRKTGNEYTLTSANLTLNFGDGSAIIRNTGIEPIYEDEMQTLATTKEFTIQNTSNKVLYVTLSLEELTASSELKNEYFHWNLYETTSGSETLVNSGNFDIDSATTLDMINDITFSTNETKSYKLYVWLEETLENQNALQGLSFSSRIVATGYLKSLQYKDNSGANQPVLADGMIPVVYDETSGNWEVADTKKEWYNYDEQWWANAVTTSDASYRTSPAGTEIPMSSINSMWVWIPRYKYRIPSNIGSSSNVTSPPEIDVVFENGTSTTGASLEDCPIDATDCYYTHPAFRDGSSVYKITAYDQGGWDEELTGIWVGKFETGGSASMPLIKPDIQSLRNQTVYDQFVTSLKFAGGAKSGSAVTFSGNTTYGLTGSTDTHMMKNTEWGAVAYLSQSKYGKMGNPNYSGVNKEIYVNNSSYYTGRSGGSPASGSSSYGTYSYIGKTCSSATCTGSQNILSGTGASTTGTVYGIYDMSAGLYEYTMGNWEGTVWTAEYPTNILPGSKYYDIYTGTSNNSITSDKSIKGDATYETMRWYSDGAYFPYAINPWFYRGGGSHDTANIASNGVFNSNRGDDSQAIGSALPYVGFRTVLIP